METLLLGLALIVSPNDFSSALQACGARPAADQAAAQKAHDAYGQRPGRAVVDLRRTWPDSSTIRVRIFSEDAAKIALVKQAVGEWKKYVSLTFEFVTSGDAEWRIDFPKDLGVFNGLTVGLGTDMLIVPQAFANIRIKTVQIDLLLHEMGHALGFEHELQSPNAVIKYKKPKLYEYFGKLGWSKADVDKHILEKTSTEDHYISAFDPASIMAYPIPGDCTESGFSIVGNTELSVTDQQIARIHYPGIHLDLAKAARVKKLHERYATLTLLASNLSNRISSNASNVALWTKAKTWAEQIDKLTATINNPRVKNEEYKAECAQKRERLREDLEAATKTAGAAGKSVLAYADDILDSDRQSHQSLSETHTLAGQCLAEIVALGVP